MKNRFTVLMACALLVAAVAHADEKHSGSKSGTASDAADTATGTTSGSTGTTTGTTTGVGETGTDQMAQTGVEMGRDYTVITFERGSDQLTENEKSNIRSMVEKAKAAGEIENVRIVAWSDKQLPTGREDLSKADRDLAKSRLDNIENFVKKDLGLRGVKSYSMAEHKNFIARTFNAADEELRSIFGRRGADTEVSHEEMLAIKEKGGPMKAVVIVQRAGRSAAGETESPMTDEASGQ